ncbi:T9SS type A sorting domain-containing protein, partial [Gilvibacter sp.]
LNIVSATNQTKDVVVYDVLGQKVLQSQVTNSRLNIGALSSGIYLVQVTENGATSTKKLVVR